MSFAQKRDILKKVVKRLKLFFEMRLKKILTKLRSEEGDKNSVIRFFLFQIFPRFLFQAELTR